MNGTATNYSAAFRECLETLDVALMRKLWRHVQPNMEQPASDDDTLVAIHLARTECKAVKIKLRMWSHCWLRERGYPSLLPDHMRASAERMYPTTVKAVGIACKASSDLMKPVIGHVQKAMENAVLEAYADDRNASDVTVKQHMMEARKLTLGKLLGRFKL